MKFIRLFSIFLFYVSTVHAAPHFFIQMQNQSEKNVDISFQQVTGEVELQPKLQDHTMLLAKQKSLPYGVVFNHMGRNDTFNILFKGEQNCAFNVAFYAPNNPKITISGLGCFGGGYNISGNVLNLFISDIHFK